MSNVGQLSVVFSAMSAKYFADVKKAEGATGKWARTTEAHTQRVSQAFKKAGMAMTGVGLLIVGMLARQTKAFMKQGDALHKMSLRTGFAVKELDRLSFIARRSGTDINAMENSIRRFQRGIFTAGEVAKTTTDTLEEMGLTIDELRSLKPEEAFNKTMHALAGVEDKSKRASYAQELFGRSGTALIPIIAEGQKAYEEMSKSAEANAFWTEENARQAALLQDTLGDLGASLRNLGMQFISPLIPHMQKLAEWFRDVANRVRDWGKENPELMESISKLTAKIGLLLISMGMLAIGWGILKKIGMVALFKKVGMAVAGLVKIFLLPLAKVALFATGAYLVWKNWSKITGLLGKALEWIADKAKWAWEGVVAGAKWAGNKILDAFQWSIDMTARVFNGLLTAGTAVANALISVFEFLAKQITKILNVPLKAINALTRNRVMTWGMEKLGMGTPEQIELMTAPEVKRLEAPRIEAPDARKELKAVTDMAKDAGAFIWDSFKDEHGDFFKQIADSELVQGFKALGDGNTWKEAGGYIWESFAPEAKAFGKEMWEGSGITELPSDMRLGYDYLAERLNNWLSGFSEQVDRIDSIEKQKAYEDMSEDARRIFGMGGKEDMGMGRAEAITPAMLYELMATIKQRPQVIETKLEVNNPMSPGEEERLLRKAVERIKEVFKIDEFMRGRG